MTQSLHLKYTCGKRAVSNLSPLYTLLYSASIILWFYRKLQCAGAEKQCYMVLFLHCKNITNLLLFFICSSTFQCKHASAPSLMVSCGVWGRIQPSTCTLYIEHGWWCGHGVGLVIFSDSIFSLGGSCQISLLGFFLVKRKITFEFWLEKTTITFQFRWN